MNGDHIDTILLDSDFLYSVFFHGQSTHFLAEQMAFKISEKKKKMIILNHVKFEFLTLLSKREGQLKSIKTGKFLEQIPDLKFVHITKLEESEIFKLFCNFDKKNISMVDCANLYYAKKNNLKIASFDKFYPKEILFKI